MPEFEWDMNIENLKNGIVAVDKKAQAAVEMYAKIRLKCLNRMLSKKHLGRIEQEWLGSH